MITYWECFHSLIYKGFWACPGDQPPDMPKRPIQCPPGDSPQSNNRLGVPSFIPNERPHVKHSSYCLYDPPTSTSAIAAVEERNRGTCLQSAHGTTPYEADPSGDGKYYH